MKYDATRNPPLRPPVPRRYKRTAFPTAPINTFKMPSEQKRRAGDHARMPGRSRKQRQKKKALPVWKEPTHRGKFPCRERNSPPVRRRTKEKPSASASRGAEAIPATRERRSRRAYHPRSGKMRADLPPAASGGQGTRHAAATPATTRDKGEYGGRRGCRGARPSHPLPHLCCRCP